MKACKTAILIFANSAKTDGISKPFQSSFAIFEQLNQHIFEKVKRSGLPYFLITEREQVGTTFGERFTNAIKDIYDRGFENVVAIGNDSPQLKVSQLKKTAEILNTKKMILGPAKDGGFYLLGLHKSLFDRKKLQSLPWQTPILLKSLSALGENQNVQPFFLKILSDVDCLSDLKDLLNTFSLLPQFLKKRLLSILEERKVVFSVSKMIFNFFFKEDIYNKGSPVFKLS